MLKNKGNLKQHHHSSKAQLNRKFSKKPILSSAIIQNENIENTETDSLMLTDSTPINLYQNSLTDTMNIDQSSNNRQILIDQIISLTCELSETSIVLLKKIAQQLANDQYSE